MNSNDDYDDYDSQLSILMDMFPTVSRSILQEHLLENNNDLELTICLLLKENEEKATADNELHQLYDMFPHINCDIIKDQFITNEKSVELTISDLLNYEILQKLKQDQKIPPDSIQQDRTKNNWKLTNDHIQTIIKFTDAPKDIAQKYFVENSFDPIGAVIKIVLDYYDKDHFPQTSTTANAKTRFTAPVRGGRVQSSMGLAHVLKQGEKSTKEGEENTKRATTYKHSLSSPQMIELNDMIEGNHDLKAINHEFLQKCLQFYDGDITKVLDLSSLLIKDDKSITKTWNIDGGFTLTSQDNCKQHSSKPSTPPISHKNGVNKSPFQNEETREEAAALINNLFQTYRLDFHGFLPNEAVSILKLALNKWWSKEVTERELNSHNINTYGSKVQFVSPLVVVTGRGIHSVGGVSKVRLQVKNFLEKNHYVFWEESSFFRVEGKRRK